MAADDTPKKGRPTQGKKARAEARRRAAERRRRQNILLGVGTLCALRRKAEGAGPRAEAGSFDRVLL